MAPFLSYLIVGLLIGIGRLSPNWLISRLCTVYVEIFRNIPPLLVIFFWYLGVLALLPTIRSIFQHVKDNPDASFFISNRGIYMPAPIFGPDFIYVVAVFAIGADRLPHELPAGASPYTVTSGQWTTGLVVK